MPRKLEGQQTSAQLELEALVEKASKGDRDALCELCEKIAKSILFQVTYILGNPAGVEDVSQEVLIRVCENIHNLRSPKAFKSWLSRIIINEKNRYLAKNMRQGDVLNIDDYLEKANEESEDFIPQEYVENRELREKVREIIMELPMRQREAVILHYYDGLSVTEIAKVLEVATQSVSKNLAIARGKLKKELGLHLREEGHMDSMAMLPFGAALGEILYRECANLAMGEAYIQGFLAKWGQQAIANSTPITSMLSAAPDVYGALAGVCATVFAAAAVVRVRK